MCVLCHWHALPAMKCWHLHRARVAGADHRVDQVHRWWIYRKWGQTVTLVLRTYNHDFIQHNNVRVVPSARKTGGESQSTYVLFTASNTACPTSLTLDGASCATRSWHFFLAAASRASIAAAGTGLAVVRGMDLSSCSTSTRWILDARTILNPDIVPLLADARGDVSHTAEATARRMYGAIAFVCPVSSTTMLLAASYAQSRPTRLSVGTA